MPNYTVQVKPGHPIGTYRRDGWVFTVGEPVTLSTDELTEAIAADPWLVVRALPEPAPATKDEFHLLSGDADAAPEFSEAPAEPERPLRRSRKGE